MAHLVLRRPYDLAAIALVLAACLVLVEAGWQAPRIDPSQAAEHIGQRVEMEGMVAEVRHFGNGGGRVVLVAGGAAIHATVPETEGLVRQAWVVAEGLLRRDGGLPLLEAESVTTTAPPAGELVPIAQVAGQPEEHVDLLLQVEGTAGGGVLAEAGHRVRLIGDHESGPQRLDGILRYDGSCLCYAFYVGTWQP